MFKTLILSVIVSPMLLVQAEAETPRAAPQKINAILCQTEAQATQLASSLASGKTEPIAVNMVNKASGAEVCGRYVGYAVVEIEKTENKDGGLYMLAGLRFAEDGRLAWTANWVAPFDGSHLARGT
jgi:hypothetical protein